MVQTITIKLQTIIALAVLLVFFSCNQVHQQRPTSFSPKAVAAHGYVIPRDSLPEPKVVPAAIPKVVKAGKPKVIPTNTNVHPAGNPRVVIAGVPKICTPGQDGFSLPKRVPAIVSAFLPGLPEVELAKEADTKEQSSQNFSFFSKRQGLKSTHVTSMLEDNNGNLWFGTFVGATKFDGKNFTHYTQKQGLISNAVSCMLEDKNGNLWFGKVNTGVTKYDGKTFTNFTKKEGLSNNRVLSIGEDKYGNIWVGTENGVNRYDGVSFTWFTEKEGLSNNFVYSILKDKSGNLCFGTDGGISKYDGKSFTNFTVKEGLSDNHVRSITEDRGGNLWIGTLGGGVNKFDGKSFTRFGEKEGLSNDVVGIREDKRGNLWFGTAGGGVSKYDGKNFTAFTDKEGLSDNNVLSILEDKSGNLWFGTLSGGVNKYSGKNFTHFTVSEGLSSNNIRCILEDKSGNLWVGTDGGMNKYNGKSFTHFTKKEGLGSNAVLSCLEDSKGCLWIGTLGAGVDKYDGKRFTHFTEQEGLIDNNVVSILEDKKGDLWFATFRGMSNYNGKTFTNFAWTKGLSNHSYYRTAEDKKGNLWFGSPTGGGAVRYDGKSFTRFTEREGLSNNFVRSIFDDKSGNLWFATLDGISEYDGQRFTYYTEKEGLSNNDVWCINADKSGDLWFGTAVGLNRLKKENRTLIKTRANKTASNLLSSGLFFESYTYDDGFLGIGVNAGKTICEASDGTIWIGASDRLTAFHPGDETPDTTVPNVQLTGLTLFNEKIPWQNLMRSYTKDHHGQGVGDTSIVLSNGVRVLDLRFDGVSKWYALPEQLSLLYNNNNLTFEFVGITMRSPKKVKYQYKLEGHDKNWSAISNRTEAPYGNLPYGKYTFKVKAMNGQGYWSKEFDYSFIIRPPWWLTWPAYVTYILIFIVALWSFIKWRERKLRNEKVMLEEKVAVRTDELQKEKEKVEDTLAQLKTLQDQLIEKEKINERLRISRELHDDVGSTLSGIVLYSHLAEDQVQAQQTGEVKNSLNKIQHSANDMVSRLNDIVWAVNPDHNSLKKLVQKLEEYATEMAMVKNIKVQVNIPESIAALKLPVEILHNIYLLFKEAINNSVKYSNASSLELSVRHLNHLMEFILRDNGEGFDMVTIKKGNGIMNMQKRAEEIGGEFCIKSSISGGTTVSLKSKIT